MTETSRNARDAQTKCPDRSDVRRSTRSSLEALLALAGIAGVVGVIDLFVQGQVPTVAAALASWDWVVNVILVILAIAIVILVIRTVFRGLGVAPHELPRERRARRYGSPDGTQSRDPAVEIARARFARGEVNPEQLDQMLSQLGKSS